MTLTDEVTLHENLDVSSWGGGVSFVRWLRVPVWIAAAVVAGWVADLLVPGFRLDGSLAVRLAVGGAVVGATSLIWMGLFLVAAIVVAAVFAGLTALIRWLVNPRGSRRTRSGRWARPFDRADGQADGGASGESATRKDKRPRHPAVNALLRAFYLALMVAVVPVGFFLAVLVLRFVGLGVEVSGGWTVYLAAGLVVVGVDSAVTRSLRPPTERNRLRPWVGSHITFVVVTAVLWLAVEYADGVHLISPGSHPVVVDVLVMAAVVHALRNDNDGLWGAAVQAPLDVLALGFVAWLGTWLVSSLEFSGVLPLVLTAVVITVTTLPARRLFPTSLSSSTASSLPGPLREVNRWRRRGEDGAPEWSDAPA